MPDTVQKQTVRKMILSGNLTDLESALRQDSILVLFAQDLLNDLFLELDMKAKAEGKDLAKLPEYNNALAAENLVGKIVSENREFYALERQIKLG